MKVLFNTCNQYITARSNAYKTDNKLSFRSQILTPETIKFSNIKKITSEAEYERVLNYLKENNLWTGFWNYGDKFEQGLMPYIGKEDISSRINSYLRWGELFDGRYSKFTIENIIRLLDYSLGVTDQKYGKYEGIVYRYGKVDKESKNFISTARNPYGIMEIFPMDDRRNPPMPFHIIYTKNGHKVEEVQKKLRYNPIYEDESEILINPTTFEEIKVIPAEMLDAALKLKEVLNKNHIYNFQNFIFLKEV